MRQPSPHGNPNRFALVLLCLLLGDLATAFVSPILAAPQSDQKITGRLLRVLKDAQSVAVEQDGRLLVRYRFGSVPRKPYVAELMSPDGVNLLRDARADHLHHHGRMFACTANGVDFWTEAARRCTSNGPRRGSLPCGSATERIPRRSKSQSCASGFVGKRPTVRFYSKSIVS